MKILFAPDSYGGFLSAPEAVRLAQAVCPRWQGHPMSDGGEGLLDALLAHRPELVVHQGEVTGPQGQPRQARWLEDRARGLLLAEAAEANGLRWVQGPPRGLETTSRGVGELLVRHLLPRGLPVRLGLGGSATVDGGQGAAEVLSAGADLSGVEVWCDVRTPLADACRLYGPQKGLSPEEIGVQTARLLAWAAAQGSAVPLDVAGGGAAGGLGYFLAARGARLTSGAAAFARETALDARLAGVEVVVLGEGRLDATSRQGKVAGVVQRLALARGVRVAALVGSASADGQLTGPMEEIRKMKIDAFQAAAARLDRRLASTP